MYLGYRMRNGAKRVAAIMLAAGIAMLLNGCATEAKYRQSLDVWLNKDQLSLVRAWGPPQQSYEVDGHQFLRYIREESYYKSGTPTEYVTQVEKGANQTTVTKKVTEGEPARVVVYSCITTFEIFEGQVIGSSYTGNDCTAY